MKKAEHEDKKRELRARLETERTVPARTVTNEKEIEIRNTAYWANLAVLDPLRLKYMKEVVRDQYGVHPDDQEFVKDKLQEILKQYDQYSLLEKKLLQQVWVIGTLLFQLKEKVFDHQWHNFCRAHFKLSIRQIQRYMQLAENRPKLEEYFGRDINVASGEMPGIAKALEIVRTWTNKRKKSTSSRKVTLKEYCPTCGQTLTKSAKVWMKDHPTKR